MIYSLSLVVASSNTKTNKKVASIDVCAGIIHQGVFLFPAATSLDFRCQVFLGPDLLWPTNISDNIRGLDKPVTIRDYHPVTNANNNIRVEAWQTGLQSAGVIYVYVHILPAELIKPISLNEILPHLQLSG